MSEDCFAPRLKSGTLNLQKKGNFSFIPATLLLWESAGNAIIAQTHRRLFPMLSANVDDALSSVVALRTNSIASDGLKTTSFSTNDFLLS